MKILTEKLVKKTARVGVVGLGYVGLPLAIELASGGYTVVGIDISAAKVAMVNEGKSYIPDVEDAVLAPLVESGKLRATTDWDVVSTLDAISVAVPTPLRKTKDPDISYIRSACVEIAKRLEGATLVVLESTTYPGTTEELVAPILSSEHAQLGNNLFVAFSPERIDPGNQTYGTRNTPKVVGGITTTCTEMAQAFYAGVVDTVHCVGSAKEAEMVKLLENTFRAVNIALVNEMLLMCDRMDIDIWRVVNAAATKPFGFMPFYPGPGIGGHCIPIDPMYLSWKAKTFDFFNRFIELATDINGNMPRFVVQKLMRVLNDREKHIRGSKIMILGMAYKGGVTDTRESPGTEVFQLLMAHGADVCYHDPYVESMEIQGTRYRSLPLNTETLAQQVCVIVSTAHKEIDWDLVADAPLVFDARNAFGDLIRDNIVRL